MGIQGPMPGCRHAAVRMPDPGQRDDQIAPTPLRQELDRRMARAQPHLDPVAEADPLRPPPRSIDADGAGILLADVPGLVKRREVHGESLAEEVLRGGDGVRRKAYRVQTASAGTAKWRGAVFARYEREFSAPSGCGCLSLSGMKLGVLTDVHANLPALEAVLRLLESEQCDGIIHTGDAIGISPHPAECLDLLLRCGAELVMGNQRPTSPSASTTGRTRLRSWRTSGGFTTSLTLFCDPWWPGGRLRSSARSTDTQCCLPTTGGWPTGRSQRPVGAQLCPT